MNTIESFVSRLQNEVRKSPHTVSSYKRSIEVLKAYCDRLQIANWNIIDPHAFADDCIRAGMSAASVNTTLCACWAFYRYLIAQRCVDANPFEKVVVPETRKQISPDMLLDMEQVKSLLEVRGDDVYAVRDKAILQLFYSSGIRLRELIDLDIDDVALDREAPFVHIRFGKGRKERFADIGNNAVNSIQSWLAVRYRLANVCEDALFVSRVGIRPAPRSIRSMVAKRGLESIDIHVHPHMLRRAYATHFIAGGGGAFCLRDNMGHSFIATTERYVAMDNAARFGNLRPGVPPGLSWCFELLDPPM